MADTSVETSKIDGLRNGPRQVLSLTDATALIVGIVVGAGIFRTPSLVAANSGSSEAFLGAWLLGGVISLLGILCYAELTTTFPNTGGDYHFLTRAYGRNIGFLFAWARLAVIQTGSIALLAFIFGDYASQIFSIGENSSAFYAAFAVIALTLINIAGIGLGTGTQKILTAAEVSGLLLITAAGFFLIPGTAAVEAPPAETGGAFGLMMVFVLLTFGGWNEAAYISAEVKPDRRGRQQIAVAFLIGIVAITALYLLVNLAYLNALGLSGVAGSTAVGVDVMRLAFGDAGVVLIGVIVAISALTSANATIFTGARTNYALGRDFSVFRTLGRWNTETGAPVNAFVVQGAIALLLVFLGLITRKGFETTVEYTAPVFWFFFLLVGAATIVLRIKEPTAKRPFRVPLYPIVPVLFCLTSAYLLYSSVAYTGIGAFIGVGVLILGALILVTLRTFSKSVQQPQEEIE